MGTPYVFWGVPMYVQPIPPGMFYAHNPHLAPPQHTSQYGGVVGLPPDAAEQIRKKFAYENQENESDEEPDVSDPKSAVPQNLPPSNVPNAPPLSSSFEPFVPNAPNASQFEPFVPNAPPLDTIPNTPPFVPNAPSFLPPSVPIAPPFAPNAPEFAPPSAPSAPEFVPQFSKKPLIRPQFQRPQSINNANKFVNPPTTNDNIPPAPPSLQSSSLEAPSLQPTSDCWGRIPQKVWQSQVQDWDAQSKEIYSECVANEFARQKSLNEKTVNSHLSDTYNAYSKQIDSILNVFIQRKNAYEKKLASMLNPTDEQKRLLLNEYKLLTDSYEKISQLRLIETQDTFSQKERELKSCFFVRPDDVRTAELKANGRNRLPAFGVGELSDATQIRFDPSRLGFKFVGNWKPNSSYDAKDFVVLEGKAFVSLVNDNMSLTDDISKWEPITTSEALLVCGERQEGPSKVPNPLRPPFTKRFTDAKNACPPNSEQEVPYFPAVGKSKIRLAKQCNDCGKGYTRIGDQCIDNRLVNSMLSFLEKKGQIPKSLLLGEGNAVNVLGTRFQVLKPINLDTLPTIERALQDIYDNFSQYAATYVQNARSSPDPTIRASTDRLVDFFYETERINGKIRPRLSPVDGKPILRKPPCASDEDEWNWESKKCMPVPERVCTRKNALKKFVNGVCVDDEAKICAAQNLFKSFVNGQCVTDAIKCNADPIRSYKTVWSIVKTVAKPVDWIRGHSYKKDDLVSYKGISYLSLDDNNR